MPNPIELLRSLTDPDKLSQLLSSAFQGFAAYAFLGAIIFSETGLLVGFFLPGDSLLFTIGVLAGIGQLNLGLIILALSVACILGDNVGYLLGYRTGEGIFQRPNSRLFKQEYVHKTKAFFDRHGGKAIIYARFVPIVRTFTPFMAGVGRMPYSRFLFFSLFGGIGWVAAMSFLGYKLGGVPVIRQHFEKVVILIILISVTPVLLELWRGRKSAVVER